MGDFTYSAAPTTTGAVRVLHVNFWSKGRARLDGLVQQLDMDVSVINPDAAESMFSNDAPDVVLVGFGVGNRRAATFIMNYKASAWYRRVPLMALIESRDEGLLWLCMEWGCDDAMLKPIRAAQLRARVRTWALRRRLREQERAVANEAIRYSQRAAEFAEIIVPLGVAMMAETDFEVLLEMILAEARGFSNADGGTLYLLSESTLEYKIIANASLNIAYPRTPVSALPFNPKPLPLERGVAQRHIACYVAVTGETVNITNAYEDGRFDLSGVHRFDKETGYCTRTILTIALRNKAGDIIGVLQLINARDKESGEFVAFTELDEEFIGSLSVLAGQALESYRNMARLRRQANALVINIDETEKAKQVTAITSSEYFQKLKAKAGALRVAPEPMETASSP